MIGYVADQSLELVLNDVENQGNRALLNGCLVLQHLLGLGSLSGQSTTALRSLSFWALTDLVLLDITIHYFIIELNRLFLRNMVR